MTESKAQMPSKQTKIVEKSRVACMAAMLAYVHAHDCVCVLSAVRTQVVNMIMGSVMTSFAEGLALADKVGSDRMV